MGNFCKDCKHAKRQLFAPFDYEYARCARSVTISTVTGKGAMQQCYVARNYGACSPSGALFEPKRNRSMAPVAAGLVLAILAGAVFPDAAHAAPYVERPDSNAASIGLALIVFGIIAFLASLAVWRRRPVEDSPEDYDSAGRL